MTPASTVETPIERTSSRAENGRSGPGDASQLSQTGAPSDDDEERRPDGSGYDADLQPRGTGCESTIGTRPLLGQPNIDK
jgi:hypothetical protein